MMNKGLFGACFLLSFILFTGHGYPQMFQGLKAPPSQDQFEKTQKRVETLRMWKLTQTLDLDEKTAASLFPVINEYDRKRLETERKMRKNMTQLRRSVDSATEEDIQDLVKELKANHDRLQQIQNDELNRLRDILSVRDMAKVIIFKQDFDREMKRRIFEARERRIKKFRDEAFRTSPPPAATSEKEPPAEGSR